MNSNRSFQEENYSQLIKSIKKRERRAILIWIGSVVLVALLSTPSVLGGGTGLPMPLALAILGISFMIYLFYTGTIRACFTNALDIECDPKKYRALLEYQNIKPRNHMAASSQMFSAAFFAGEFEEALEYANDYYEKSGSRFKVNALFCKIRVCYFMGDMKQLEQCVNEFYSLRAEPMKEGEGVLYSVLTHYVDAMVALSKNDVDALKEISPRLVPWRDTNIVRIQTDYFQGISAYITGKYEDAEYKLSRVCEFGAKTFLGALAKACLEKPGEEKNRE